MLKFDHPPSPTSFFNQIPRQCFRARQVQGSHHGGKYFLSNLTHRRQEPVKLLNAMIEKAVIEYDLPPTSPASLFFLRTCFQFC
jgi:hypothetical protein